MELRAALDRVPPAKREAWVDELLGLDGIPDDSDALPPGCVPYLPCPIDTIVAMLDRAEVGAQDVFVDIGAGIGRVTALAHLLTGASAIGIEVQPHLVERARSLGQNIALGDAADVAGELATGTVFFLYCPFSGERLERVLARIEAIAATRPIRVCTVDLPPLERSWLVLKAPLADGLAVYTSQS